MVNSAGKACFLALAETEKRNEDKLNEEDSINEIEMGVMDDIRVVREHSLGERH